MAHRARVFGLTGEGYGRFQVEAFTAAPRPSAQQELRGPPKLATAAPVGVPFKDVVAGS